MHKYILNVVNITTNVVVHTSIYTDADEAVYELTQLYGHIWEHNNYTHDEEPDICTSAHLQVNGEEYEADGIHKCKFSGSIKADYYADDYTKEHAYYATITTI